MEIKKQGIVSISVPKILLIIPTVSQSSERSDSVEVTHRDGFNRSSVVLVHR